MRFSELATGYLKYKAAKGASPRTGDCYEQAYSQFRSYLAAQGLEDDIRNFTEANVEAYAVFLSENGRKAITVNNRLTALASLGTYGTRLKKLKYNPADKRIERAKVVKPPERYLYRQELVQLLGVQCPAEEQLVLELFVDTNLRASELAEAKVKHLSMDGDRVLLAITQKGGNGATLELGKVVADKLIESLRFREAGPEEPLLLSPRGVAYDRRTISKTVTRLARRAGITRFRVGAHVLARHSPASIMGQEGASVFEIAAMLRHSDTNTAKRYVHGVSGDAVRARWREELGR